MNSKEAGIFVLFWFSLKERGSVGLKVLTRNKGEHLPHPLDLWNVGGKKKCLFGGYRDYSICKGNWVLVKAAT